MISRCSHHLNHAENGKLIPSFLLQSHRPTTRIPRSLCARFKLPRLPQQPHHHIRLPIRTPRTLPHSLRPPLNRHHHSLPRHLPRSHPRRPLRLPPPRPLPPHRILLTPHSRHPFSERRPETRNNRPRNAFTATASIPGITDSGAKGWRTAYCGRGSGTEAAAWRHD